MRDWKPDAGLLQSGQRRRDRRRSLWAPRAWLGGALARRRAAARSTRDGHWADDHARRHAPPAACERLAGPLLPGLVDAHSHAFQRAFAGLAERISAGDGAADDFWSWRDRMYGVALRITPEQLRAIAAQLYVELLRGGYTQVCEFHYLQHADDGRPTPTRRRWPGRWPTRRSDAGIGLTLLPVLYERAGFAAAGAARRPAPLREHAAERRAAPARASRAARRPLVNAGVAIHSLRAASAAVDRARCSSGSATRRPDPHPRRRADAPRSTTASPPPARGRSNGCAAKCRVDARWQLVHATHATPREIDAVAASGAGIVLCPSTEANLGDGLADLPRWLDAGVPITIGSDSQVVARLAARSCAGSSTASAWRAAQRNVAAAPAGGIAASTAAHLVRARTRRRAPPSAGFARWGLVAGARADALVVDLRRPALLGMPRVAPLDALVFATDAPPFSAVYVGGRRVIDNGRHVQQANIEARFTAAMAALWSEADRLG